MKSILLSSVFAAALLASPARGDMVMDWNAKADAIATEKRIVNVPQARTLAMMHLAMFEAVNAIERRYASYKLDLTADRGTSREAAASAAAHGILLTVYPDQKTDLDALLNTSLAAVPDSPAKASGMELGRKAAAGIIALRANDGTDRKESYRPQTAPGAYVPTVIPIESTSGALKPFVMASGSQFRAPTPPSLTSETWTRDVNEIRELGGRTGSKRTEEQTTIGRFWFLSGPRTYNPIVRQIATARKMDLLDSARIYALASMAGHDAFIAVFEAKYTYNFWRPVTAIRNADISGNKSTPREESWLPLGETPMHPEYPCAHCIVASSVATVLGNFMEGVGEISLTSPTAPGVTRKWTRVEDYRDEVSSARIYAGFHYRFSTEAARDMGKKIGEMTFATLLRPAAQTR